MLQDVFVADKTVLFFKLEPDKTIAYEGDSYASGKCAKECVTILVAVNMTGIQKVSLFAIWTAHKPRCLRNTWLLLTEYAANKRASMIGEPQSNLDITNFKGLLEIMNEQLN